MTALFHSTSPTSTPLTVTAVSLASPREAEGIHSLYPLSFVKAPQFGPTSRWHAQSCGCAWETKARSRDPDLPVIRWVFAQDCVRANARAGDPEWFTVSCEWPPHPLWCAQRFGYTHIWRQQPLVPLHTLLQIWILVLGQQVHHSRSSAKLLVRFFLFFFFSKLKVNNKEKRRHGKEGTERHERRWKGRRWKRRKEQKRKERNATKRKGKAEEKKGGKLAFN